MKIYNRIKVLRTERELTRKELAAKVEVNFQTIGYLERGDYNPSLELAMKLSKVFQLPIEQIFSDEPLPSLSAQLNTEKN